jgi:hypothetical protein
MITSKLNFVGKAAESKAFKNNQVAKPIKPKYGTYTFPVPINSYNDIKLERILTGFINAFSDDDVRVVVEDVRDKNGYRKHVDTITFHLIPPMTAKEKAESDERVRKSLEEQEGANKKRKQQKRKETKMLKAQSDARKASRTLADEPKKKAKGKSPTKAKKAKKAPSKTSKSKAKKKAGLKPLTLADLKRSVKG